MPKHFQAWVLLDEILAKDALLTSQSTDVYEPTKKNPAVSPRTDPVRGSPLNFLRSVYAVVNCGLSHHSFTSKLM